MKPLTVFVCLSLIVALVSPADAEDGDDVSMAIFKKFKVRIRSFPLLVRVTMTTRLFY
jgi:hypothetical protein